MTRLWSRSTKRTGREDQRIKPGWRTLPDGRNTADVIFGMIAEWNDLGAGSAGIEWGTSSRRPAHVFDDYCLGGDGRGLFVSITQLAEEKEGHMTTTQRFDVYCQQCDQPIADGEGYLWVDYQEIASTRKDQEDEMKERAKRTQGGRSVTLTRASDVRVRRHVPWQAHHEACDPALSQPSYWIGVDMVRTWQDLLRRTEHLTPKNWLRFTDWHQLLGRAADNRGFMRSQEVVGS